MFDLLVVDQANPLRELSRREVVQVMNVALANLPEQYREAIRLQFTEGKSYQEIAAAMHTTEGAVQGWIKRAKRRLRDSLGNASAYFSSR